MTDNAHLFGWCSGFSGDQYHSLCRVEYRTQWGVTMRCSCPNHDDDTDEEDTHSAA